MMFAIRLYRQKTGQIVLKGTDSAQTAKVTPLNFFWTKIMLRNLPSYKQDTSSETKCSGKGYSRPKDVSRWKQYLRKTLDKRIIPWMFSSHYSVPFISHIFEWFQFLNVVRYFVLGSLLYLNCRNLVILV
jgi:hypothetical protein